MCFICLYTGKLLCLCTGININLIHFFCLSACVSVYVCLLVCFVLF